MAINTFSRWQIGFWIIFLAKLKKKGGGDFSLQKSTNQSDSMSCFLSTPEINIKPCAWAHVVCFLELLSVQSCANSTVITHTNLTMITQTNLTVITHNNSTDTNYTCSSHDQTWIIGVISGTPCTSLLSRQSAKKTRFPPSTPAIVSLFQIKGCFVCLFTFLRITLLWLLRITLLSLISSSLDHWHQFWCNYWFQIPRQPFIHKAWFTFVCLCLFVCGYVYMGNG